MDRIVLLPDHCLSFVCYISSSGPQYLWKLTVMFMTAFMALNDICFIK